MKRNISIVYDCDNQPIVLINDVFFKGRRHISWEDVEAYLKNFIGEINEIFETSDKIYIGKDLPDEYSNSKYTRKLKGTLAKAKANAAQGIPEIIQIATNKHFRENLSEKHEKDARLGWYHYDTCFALPCYDSEGNLTGYNIFYAELLVRHAFNGKLYLYDIINIEKKKRSNPL
ncbi:MAG: hypothetical protein IKM19_07380 [Firmicutes bacterium]|nr:hypothetical protein [Bacillota bacterium]